MDKKQKLIKIKKAGWIYSLLCIVLGIAAINTGNNLIYIIDAAMLGFMGISGFFGVKNINGIKVDITEPDEIYAAKNSFVKVKVTNTKNFFPCFLIRIHIDDKSVLFPFIDNKSTEEKYINHTFETRGFYTVNQCIISSVYPFNFFIRFKDTHITKKILVFPEPVQSKIKKFNFSNDMKGDKETEEEGYGSTPQSVREYRDGDPFKYIHWKAYAKTGKMITKIMNDERDDPVVLELNTKNNLIEDEIKYFTYIILEMYKNKIPVGLKINELSIPPSLNYSYKLQMLKELALYGQN